MMLLRFLCLLCLYTADIRASSHWIVTETGFIQPKEVSPFLMARSFDLLSFLNQDTRWQNIFNIYNDLIMRQKRINTLWAALVVEAEISKHIAENEYCQATGDIDSIDWYTSFLEDGRFKGIQDREFMLDAVEEYGDSNVPDCKKISSLTFSMAAFEHLEGMINREHLNATPEFTLPELFSSIMSVDQYGHWLSEVLRKNSTSWLHYNLAALYWRVKGNVPKALECSRRAVHHSPRYHKNVPLLCMGTILHRSKVTEDAIIVLGAAVDHDPYFPISHFSLSQAYAIMGDYNESMKHLDISMKLHNNFEMARKFRNGVLCHIDMLTKMQYAQRTLKKLSDELAEYNELDMTWLKIQTAFMKTIKLEQEFDYKNIEWTNQKMFEITGLNIKDLRKDSDRNSVIQYFISSPIYNEQWVEERGIAALDLAHSLQRTIKSLVEKTGGPTMNLLADNIQAPLNKTNILKEIGPMPLFPDVVYDFNKYVPQIKTAETKTKYRTTEVKPDNNLEIGTLKPDTEKVLYPSNMKVNRNKEDFDTDPDWPSNAFCKEAAPKFPDNVEAIYPVYMPFEHKGISIKTLLTEMIGVPAFKEHELPWHPPICPTDKDISIYTSKKGLKVQVVSETIAVNMLRPKLLRYLSTASYDVVKKIQDAEIGQRIYVAMKRKLASKWVLYTLASLYWRVRGNTLNALNCLLTASHIADTRYRDVVLVSLASLFLEMGFIDDSSMIIEDAYRLSPFEPPTNFLLAQLSMIKKNHKAQLFHLKQSIRVEPLYMNGFARNLLNAWSCILKQVNTLRELGVVFADIDGDKDLCAEMEPGVSMVCERDGTNCHVSNTHCTVGTSKESSTLVRMLNDENTQKDSSDDINAAYFNKFLKTMPVERHDKVGHQKSYDLMMKTVANLVKGCGAKGCHEVNLRGLNMKKEECDENHLHLEYWLNAVSFKQQLVDTNSRLPEDIAATTPSQKKIPECRIPINALEDFFITRILAVDAQDWVGIRTLMHHFADTFQFIDFPTLGTKIAKYVEASPSSWEGLTAAAWWCGASGRGACTLRCVAAAHAHAPHAHRPRTLYPLIALLHMQSRPKDAKDMAYLAFYSAPKGKIEALMVGVSHTYNHEYEEAIWMYRYAVSFDEKLLPAKACLHITMCLMVFGDYGKRKTSDPPRTQ